MLHVHRADRADALVRALGTLLAARPDDPFAAEVVGVPTRGVERWLTQTLSNHLGASVGRGDGIVANVAFPSPRQIVDDAVAAACGVDPSTDAWVPERTLWPLLEIVDDQLDAEWLTVLADHLRDSAPQDGEDRRPRRLAAVRHLAVLFDRYALHRPQMVCAWHAGEDVDGSGRELKPQLAWQAELWRRLRDRVGSPGPAERIADAETRLRAQPDVVDLPGRLSLFGLTRLPAAQVRILRTLAAHRDVHLYVLHPSPVLWNRVATAVDHQTPARRADDPTAGVPANRLLASWGRDVRELQLVLGPAGDHTDHLESHDAPAPTTLLSRIQQHVRDDDRPPGPPPAGHPDTRPVHEPTDRSIEVHACHGRARQVEVLRDAILHALDDDSGLEPRDVIVMCPDIEAFAPLIQATFGAGLPADDDTPPTGTPDLRVRLADRALRQTNPILGTMSRLLELAGERMTASQVLDLADRPPVRRRFGFDDDALVRLGEWVGDTEIRWGLDAPHRKPFKLDPIVANTWQAGVDRVLVGATMTDEAYELIGGVLPYDDVDSGSIELAGCFAELITRLRLVVDRFATAMPISEWAVALADAADLLTATAHRDAWQRTQLDRLLATLVDDAGSDDGAPLELSEVRALLDEHLRGRPSRANFRTGHLTFCTLNPMRSVPHRVVCLLGLDDAAFPRKAPRDGDDLIFDDPHLGDHDARAEDRQLLLDALLAAKDKLIITFTGNDERTNAPMPPAVPVGELLDVVDRTVQHGDGPARDGVVIRHPLQPFDPRNFTDGQLIARGPFGFDRVTLAGARALAAPRSRPRSFLDGRLPPPDERIIPLDDLVRFVQHPARAFLRKRLGISLGDFSEELEDGLPVDLDPLAQWAVGERLLHALLAGHPIEDALTAERARGSLPPGRLADGVLTKVANGVVPLVETAGSILAATTELASLDVRVPLPAGRLVSGTVAGLSGDRLQAVSYSRVSPRHRLAAWVRLLALTASRPDHPFEAITLGRRRDDADWRTTVTIARIPPVDDAASRLEALVELYDRGMREPVPLVCRTSAAYAAAVHRRRDPEPSARKCWESSYNRDNEDRELEHRLLHGGVVAFEDLLADAPRTDEVGEGWDPGQSSRFGRWALRLWSDLLAVEELSER